MDDYTAPQNEVEGSPLLPGFLAAVLRKQLRQPDVTVADRALLLLPEHADLGRELPLRRPQTESARPRRPRSANVHTWYCSE
jgi:hypothetical protein